MINIHAEINGMTQDVEYPGTDDELRALLATVGVNISTPPGQTGPVDEVWLKLRK